MALAWSVEKLWREASEIPARHSLHPVMPGAKLFTLEYMQTV